MQGVKGALGDPGLPGPTGIRGEFGERVSLMCHMIKWCKSEILSNCNRNQYNSLKREVNSYLTNGINCRWQSHLTPRGTKLNCSWERAQTQGSLLFRVWDRTKPVFIPLSISRAHLMLVSPQLSHQIHTVTLLFFFFF